MSKEEKVKRVEFKLPLILLRTEKFSSLFEYFGQRRLTKYIAWIGVLIMISVAIAGSLLIINSIQSLLTRPEVAEAQREAGPQSFLLLPGFNPYLPIIYGWIGIVVGIIVHEGSHGIVAKSLRYKVHSSGLLFFLFIPVGAFVEVDEKQLQESKSRDAVRVMAAGPGANVVVSLISLGLLLALVNGIYPTVDGLYVVEVLEGYPAHKAGIVERDVIMAIDGVKLVTIEDLSKILAEKEPGETIILKIAREANPENNFLLPLKLSESTDGPRLGVKIIPLGTGSVLENYKAVVNLNPVVLFLPPTFGAAQYFIPYSDVLHVFYSHNLLGNLFYPIAQLLFWIWFININLAIFNSLPIFPLDGGQSLRSFLKNSFGNRLKDKGVKYITYAFSLIFIMLVISMIALPYFLP
ncbi:MAG: site-2 protease family protein [Nitrososphaerales archaeon]